MMAGNHRSVIALLMMALVAAGLAGFPASRAPAAPSASPRAGSAPKGGAPAPAAAARTRAPALPESVLARVGNGRDVTVSRFMAAWNDLKPPDRPDSLTPQNAREFLELLIGKEALGEAALKEHWEWTAEESAGYRALGDHLVLAAVLDSALDARGALIAARGDSVPDRGTLGVIARDSLILGLALSFDDALLERLARAFAAIPRPSRDSSITSQLRVMGTMPHVEDSLLSRPIATGRGVRYTVADLLEAWKHTNPLARPRIQSAEQVRDLAGNGIFEGEMRRAAAAQGLAERPDIARALAGRREFVAVSHLVAREVYAKIVTDSVTLERHFRARIDQWSLPLRVRVTRMVLTDRRAASQMRLRLASATEAESLVARGARVGADYRMEVSAGSDSALFAAALTAGPGSVFGPDSVRGGWAVTRVNDIAPGRRRTFSEARQLVRHSWYGEEGERLMQALLERVRGRTRVTVNEPALGAFAGASRSRAH
jgi:hypothetical protein